MARETLILEGLADYMASVIAPEPDLFQKLRAETETLGWVKAMQISWGQARFMQLIARMIGARRVVEVGTFTGYSAMAVTSVLPSDGTLVALDVSEEWTSIGQRYWDRAGVGDRIDLRIAPATETLATLIEEKGEPFDMAFIDADKGNYWNYFDAIVQLLRPGGVVLIDNVLWSGAVMDEANTEEATVALRAFNERLATDDRVDIAITPIGDGVTLAVKR